MSKRKHRHFAEQLAKQEGGHPTPSESHETAEECQREVSADRANKSIPAQRPFRIRTWAWVRDRSSFTDWCLVIFTGVLAGAAIYQFILLGGQLDTMRKDQRPWLDLTFKSNSDVLQVGIPITASAHVVNEGKTPARSVSADIVIEMVKNGEEPRLNFPLPHSRFTTGVLFPNQPMDSPVFMRVRTASDGVSAETDPVTQAELDDFNQGNSFIVVYGMVSYEDFFHVSHWTKMCGFFPKLGSTKGASAKKCTDFGNIDGN